MRITTRLVLDMETGAELLRESHEYSGPIAELRGPAQETGMLNNLAGGQGSQATNLENNTLIPGYTSMLNEGYTPGQQSAMTTSGMGAIAGAAGGANEEAANTAARTNNASNLTAQQDQIARDAGVASGNEAAGLQQKFANEQQENKKFGLEGLSGLYGQNQGASDTLYGLGAHMFAPGQSVNSGKQFSNTLGNIAGVAGAVGALGA